MPKEIAVKFFTGAPETNCLQWNLSDLTVPLLPSFTSESPESAGRPPLYSHPGPPWRAIFLQQHYLPTGFSQVAEHEYFQPSENDTSFRSDETSFLDTRNLSFNSSIPEHDSHTGEEAAAILTQFYEHSFAVHQDVPSSQVIGVQSSNDASFLTDSSELSTSYMDVTRHGLNSVKHIPASGSLTDLRDIPNAAYLRSINPQTMTVNLIFGIISIPLPRLINTRRGGKRVELIEMIVADETRAGFGINLWLPPIEVQIQGLGPVAATLRPQDIILARNVALSVFRSNVYGQSLRRDLTKLDLLYRNVVDKHDNEGVYSAKNLGNAALKDPQIIKVRKVREWVMQFVGNRPQDIGLQPVQTERLDQPQRNLPPDTQ